MPGPFNIEIEGMADLLAKFKTVEEGMIDFRQLGAWKGVIHEFKKIEMEQFRSAGGAGKSGKWAPLSPKYAAIKQKRYHGPTQILRASGALYKSLTTDGTVHEQTAQELVLGSKLPYASYHQTGTKAPSRRGGRRGSGGLVGPVLNLSGPHRGGMPARPLISLTEKQEKQLMLPIQRKLNQLLANAKLRDVRGF
jgi:phage gpG-like protein